MTGQRAYRILEVDSNGKEQGLQTFHGELSTHGSQRIEWHDNRSDEHGFLTHVNMWNIVEHCGIVYDDIDNIGWLVVDLPLWKILVSWDDDIPNIWKNNSHVPNHHPVGLDKIYHNSPTFFQVLPWGQLPESNNWPNGAGDQQTASSWKPNVYGARRPDSRSCFSGGVPSGKHTKN